MAEQVAGLEPAIAANSAQANTLAMPRPPGILMHPGVHRRVQVLAGARLADRRALQDEQRDRQQRDAGHLLVDVLRHRVERGAGMKTHMNTSATAPSAKAIGMPENITSSVATRSEADARATHR